VAGDGVRIVLVEGVLQAGIACPVVVFLAPVAALTDAALVVAVGVHEVEELPAGDSHGYYWPFAAAMPPRICSMRWRSCSCKASSAASKMWNSSGET
jgi:hypothetical protein